MDTGALMYHPTENRPLGPGEEVYVNECAMRVMQGYITRGNTTTSSTDLAKICYTTAFEMLDYRNRLMTPR
jgi:hypothetical protein